MCQCNERRAVIVQAAAGVVPVRQAAAIVATTLAQDARQVTSAALAAAKLRLRRR